MSARSVVRAAVISPAAANWRACCSDVGVRSRARLARRRRAADVRDRSRPRSVVRGEAGVWSAPEISGCVMLRVAPTSTCAARGCSGAAPRLGERERRLAVDPVQILLEPGRRPGSASSSGTLYGCSSPNASSQRVEPRRARLEQDDDLLLVGDLALPPIQRSRRRAAACRTRSSGARGARARASRPRPSRRRVVRTTMASVWGIGGAGGSRGAGRSPRDDRHCAGASLI